MKVYKIRCLKCGEFSGYATAKGVFDEGCGLCGSKKIEIIGRENE